MTTQMYIDLYIFVFMFSFYIHFMTLYNQIPRKCQESYGTTRRLNIYGGQHHRARGFKYNNYLVDQSKSNYQLELLNQNIRSADEQKWHLK